MSPRVLSFVEHFSNRTSLREWSNAELAELYRVEHALIQARMAIETDRGVTDEGDPWFVFCRADGEVIIHITRMDGHYHLCSPVLPQPLVGPTFSALTKSFLSGLRTPPRPDSTVAIHPAALLSVLVAAIFYSIDFHSTAQAATAASETRTELPSKDTLFHTFVANIKAFLEPAGAANSPHLTFFAAVETAAIFAVVALSGLAQNLMNLQADSSATTTLPDDHSGGQFGVADGRDDLSFVPLQPDRFLQQFKAGNLADQATIIVTLPGDDRQSDESAGQKLAVQGTDGPASQAKESAWNSDVNLAQTTGDSFAQNQASVLSLSDASLLASGRYSAGPANDSTDAARGIPGSGNQDVSQSGGSETIINVDLSQGSKVIDLSTLATTDKLFVMGDGALQISGIKSTDNPWIDVAADSSQTLGLTFASSAFSAFTVQLNGHDALLLANLSGDAASVHLTFDSEGGSPNNVTIGDMAISPANLNIAVIGVQDLTLTESAQVFNKTTWDLSGHTGSFTLNVNLDSVFQSVDLSQVNAANFVVGNSGNIALLQAAPGSHIQLSSDLNIVDMTIAGASANNPGSLEIDLQTSALQGGPINIGLLDIFSATILTINSAGAGPNGINTIDTLAISDFQTLTISGDSDLTINSINGLVANDNQPVTIDAHTLSGSLQIDVSGIVDSAALGRSIIIVGGTANNILTNENVSENTTFIAGAGTNVINIGSGAIDNTVVNLKPLDRVNIGNATVTDAVIDATVAGAGQQDIDQQGTLGAAARLASILHGASTPDQALLFYYQGNLYAFVDVRGDHVFDATADAIVKLVGVTDVAHLSGVFHSA